MDLKLAGRRALVLGASRGLGGAVARMLAAESADVVAASRGVEATLQWRSTLPNEIASRVLPVAFDLGNIEQVDRLADEALAGGGIDILVNNSGGPPTGPTTAMSAAAWSQHFQAMAAHLFHLTNRLLPGMLERGWGRIVTIASSGVEQPIPNLALSNGIRAAVLGWSKTLATEVAARGVTVNVVLPGRIHTDRVDQIDSAAAQKQGRSQSDVAQASAATIPAGRYGRPDEFADAVAFLVSERASYITGAKLRVDGGMIRSV